MSSGAMTVALRPCPFCGGSVSKGYDGSGALGDHRINHVGLCWIWDITALAPECEEDWNRRASAWQPIATAPRDGWMLVSFLYYGIRQKTPRVMDRMDGEFVWPSRNYVATHWQPLPAPPAD